MPSILKVFYGMDGVFVRKWEFSIVFAIAAAILWCAVGPSLTTEWWTAAFTPLCDGILTAEASGEGIVLRSKLYELLCGVF